MPNTTLGSAYVQIIPSADGISGSITNVLKGESEEAGQKAGGLFSSGFAGKIGKGLAVSTAAVGAFGAAASVAVGKAAKQTADMGDQIDKMSQKVGFSTDAYQKWNYVMELSGTDMSSCVVGLKTLTNKFDDAKNGSASAVEAFQRIGLSLEDIGDMSREELFSNVISNLQGMGDTAERAALANDLFGRSGQDLIPLLNQSADATEELMQKAEDYGMIMGEDAVKNSAAFNDALLTLQNTFSGLKNRVVGDLLPTLTQITDGLSKLLTGDMSGLDDMLNVGSQLVENLISGIMSKASELGNKAGELASQMIGKIVEKIPAFVSGAGQLVGGLITGLFNALPGIAATLGDMVSQMIKWLLAGGWKDVGLKILNLIGSGLNAALNGLLEIVKRVGSSVLEALGLDNLWQKVRDTVEKIKGFFNFKVSLPHIDLPHFSIAPAGWKLGDLLKGVIPRLDISWYAQGGIATKPVVGFGEAGPEALLPLDPFWKKMDEIAEGSGANVTINVYPSAGMDEEQLAQKIERKLINQVQNRRLAWR